MKRIKLIGLNANIHRKDYKQYLKQFYNEHLIGKTIHNKNLGIDIEILPISRKETIYGPGTISINKVIAVTNLVLILENAVLSNFKVPKEKHVKKHGAIGFLNFKAETTISGKNKNFRIPVMINKKGKFQYHLWEYK